VVEVVVVVVVVIINLGVLPFHCLTNLSLLDWIRNFGFVRVVNAEDAERALEKLNGWVKASLW